ncbi:hypothetical protein M404DRAFT_774688 [Pisolithus tinctorius Marx 270]|uniref:Uncharacterized protein n=1 Tax=Pisolithus tinctorius Marx 270 TaxID=870435 RepID=A0A0C3NXR0_PISTI|nr:hypothetical protein M404DRAFT_774688 [Pisolithus tinctorius Marx 270]
MSLVNIWKHPLVAGYHVLETVSSRYYRLLAFRTSSMRVTTDGVDGPVDEPDVQQCSTVAPDGTFCGLRGPKFGRLADHT